MNNKQLLLLFSLLLFDNLFAQNCNSQRYISEIFSNTQRTTNIKFAEADPYGLINNQDLFLDIEEPVGDNLTERPLILHQFGGGFLIGWRTEPVIPQMSEEYAKRGFVFATMDYRLGFNVLSGQSAERAVYRGAQDMNSALRFLIDNADTYGIDTSAIFVTGTSAGCFSSLVNAFMEEADRATIPSTFGILLEPDDLGCINCSGNNNYSNQRPPIHGVINNWGAIIDTSFIDLALNPKDNVPVISFHGTADNLVPFAEGNAFDLPIFPVVQGSSLIHQRLDNQGIKNRFFPLQGLGHEPQLLQLQFWVTDTILSQGSKFLYEIMYGDSIQVSGDNTVCINTTHTYSLPFDSSTISYCFNVTGGTIVSQNSNEITVQWNTLGAHEIEASLLDRREITKEASLTVTVQNPQNALINFTSTDGLATFSSPTLANLYTWIIEQTDTVFGNNANYQFTDTGLYNVRFIVDDGFCTSTADTSIESTICPDAAFTFTQNDSVLTLNSTASFNNAITWIDFDGNVYSTDTISLQLNAAGNYSFTQIVSNDFCSDTLTQSIDFNFCSTASFTVNASDLNIDFNNTSYNAFFYIWNFGDGNTSGLENPSHNYATPGTYDVTLITNSVDGCADTIMQSITVDITNSIASVNDLNLAIHPNPVNDIIQVKGLARNTNYSYKIIDLSGKVILEKALENKEIDAKQLSTGSYYLMIRANNGEYSLKLITKK